MSTQLSLHDVTKSYDHRLVLDQVTCAFPPGQVRAAPGRHPPVATSTGTPARSSWSRTTAASSPAGTEPPSP